MLRIFQELNVEVLPGTEQGRRMDMVARDIERRRLKAIRRENAEWNQVKDRASWELFRDQRLNALRASLGEFPSAPANLDFHVTGELKGPGYRIKNVVFESRPEKPIVSRRRVTDWI